MPNWTFAYDSGEDEWRIVTRPTIGLLIEQPIPDGKVGHFNRETDFTDVNIPLPVALPKPISGNWLLALGPGLSFPTATQDEFGRQQYSAGVAGIFGYMAKNWMAGIYLNTTGALPIRAMTMMYGTQALETCVTGSGII